MTRKILPYDKTRLGQDTGYFCGPATTQVLLSSRGQIIDERTLASELGTDQDGTDYIGLLETVLSRRLNVRYRSIYLQSDPPSSGQVEALWRNLRQSIDGGYGVAMNWVVPPGNRPRGILGSQSPSYPGSTVYHYVAALGYDDDARAVWVVDSGFWPREYWCSLDQVATLIPPKGYAYADVAPSQALTPPKLGEPGPAYTRESNIKTVIRVGQSMGVTPRGIKIGLATTEVESNTRVLANPKVPESMALPNQGVGDDGKSVGMWQQQVVWGNDAWWWADAKTCMDPESSSRLFFGRLLKLDYNNPARSPGSFAQEVQQSAYPDRYDEQFAAAERLYDQYANESLDPFEELLMLEVESLSIYATPGEAKVPVANMIQAIDAHGPHEPYVEKRARLGDPDALFRVARTAAGKGKYGSAPAAVNQAKAVLAEIESANPALIQSFINSQKGILA